MTPSIVPSAGARPRLVERYRRFLSVTEATPPLTLGEGATPLVRLERLGAALGLSNLYVKVFGLRDGTLYLQAYAVMEDDSRDWSKNRKRLLARLVNPKLQKKISDHDKDIDWQRVGDLAHTPRAVPVPITGELGGIDTVIADSLLVENTLPQGSNWDGKTGLLVDEKTFKELLGGRSEAPPASQTQAAVR